MTSLFMPWWLYAVGVALGVGRELWRRQVRRAQPDRVPRWVRRLAEERGTPPSLLSPPARAPAPYSGEYRGSRASTARRTETSVQSCTTRATRPSRVTAN
jgi:hypothetical protein